jgi:hypothetical protein
MRICLREQVFGPSKFKIRNFKSDVNNLIFTYKILIDKIEFRGKYQIDTKILLLKLVGNGNLTGTFCKSCIFRFYKSFMIG